MEVEINDEGEGGTEDPPPAPTIVVVGGEGESVTEGQIDRAERLAVLERDHADHVSECPSRDEIEWMIAAGVDRKATEFAELAAEVVEEIIEEVIEEVVEDLPPEGEDVVVIEDLPTPDVDDPAGGGGDEGGGEKRGRIMRALDRGW